jgi:hypothetical protein
MNSRYRAALDALAARTKTPLPSLAVSFAVVHEVTAIVPLVGLFYGARAFGIGEQLVSAAAHESTTGSDNVVKEKFRDWIHEGDLWAERIGIRYGWFGYEKGQAKRDLTVSSSSSTSGRIAGDVANAVFAYAVGKVHKVQCI